MLVALIILVAFVALAILVTVRWVGIRDATRDSGEISPLERSWAARDYGPIG